MHQISTRLLNAGAANCRRVKRFGKTNAPTSIQGAALLLMFLASLPSLAQTIQPKALPPVVEKFEGGEPEPAVLRQVTEDSQVQIEELRVRGETRSLVVRPKLVPGLPAYRMTAPDASSPQGQPSRRVWLDLNF